MDILLICTSILLNNLLAVAGQDENVGKHIGEFNSYHHQVGGDVYAVDETTILIKNFMYDGNGRDTFFWAGSKPRPGPQGFIVPNEYGRTNVLGPYLNKDITIQLPDGKTLKDIRWIAVFDLNRLQSFGDVYIFEGFEPPQRVVISKFSSKLPHVSSAAVTIVDSKTIEISKFKYDGTGEEAYFWVGIGPQPNSKGTKIPDEHGYMTPLRRYNGKTVTLTLPGDKTVFTVDWLAIFDVKRQLNLGSIIIPEELNVPPSLVTIKHHENSMPNCEQLYKDLQVSWDVFGDQVTIEIVGQMHDDDYVAFGMSGDPNEPKMIGGDVVIVYRDDYLGFVKDYNMSSYFPCSKVVGQNRGVCEDDQVGGHQDYQVHTHNRKDGISMFTFRRRLTTPDVGDIPYPEKGPAMIIWAMGRLDSKKQPTMHYAWSNVPQTIEFSRAPGDSNCFAFTQDSEHAVQSWPRYMLTNVNSVINASLGPDGGPRGYKGITGQTSSTGIAWYVNGHLTPEIVIEREKDYVIRVQGGSNPYDPAGYHPLMITDEPHGGYSQLSEEERKNVRVLAGVDYTVRGEPRSSSVGPLCIWKHYPHQDRRRDIDFLTFQAYRYSLFYECNPEENAKAGILKLHPNRSWPDVVYYNSWTGKNMGWKIHVIDSGVMANYCNVSLLLAMLLSIRLYNTLIVPI